MNLPSGVDAARRFGGVQRLYGQAGAGRIFSAHVVVVGIGGVGSWAVEALARSGVGQLTLIDLDHVAESNINRQIHALDSTLGMAKAEAMRQRIQDIHPACAVRTIEEFVTPENWPALLPPGAVSAVIDACDQMPAKHAMARWAVQQRVPFVTVGAAGGKRLAHAVELADLAVVTHDPLLARLRYRLRREQRESDVVGAHGDDAGARAGASLDAKTGKPKAAKSGRPTRGDRLGITCVFSREAVATPLDDAACAVEGDGSLNCHGYGSLVTVTSTFGMCAAGAILERLAGPQKTR